MNLDTTDGQWPHSSTSLFRFPLRVQAFAWFVVQTWAPQHIANSINWFATSLTCSVSLVERASYNQEPLTFYDPGLNSLLTWSFCRNCILAVFLPQVFDPENIIYRCNTRPTSLSSCRRRRCYRCLHRRRRCGCWRRRRHRRRRRGCWCRRRHELRESLNSDKRGGSSFSCLSSFSSEEQKLVAINVKITFTVIGTFGCFLTLNSLRAVVEAHGIVVQW